ncbi:aromatic/alkene monooxygenase hydroxylase subunit beta [Halioxenophilus aromaticivorans]|uniref:Aromatic/alkene monooxygenase hydroxylase subunit beta n=1 Tax=Halioxenophilus aromaticivorans TaxID=1306992 RepID=A0AAV3TZ48_9ALTE
MSVEIKTATAEPVRNTFAHLERRFGDKQASRYQEATYDIQPEGNEHYKPYWDKDHELVDARRTAIVMQDWYDFKDPRQFYYGSYVQQRAKMQETAESNYAFYEKRGLARYLTDAQKQQVIKFLVPLRHVEHTGNLNNMFGAAYGFGTAITQAFLYNGMDRLGIAQYLSRIGLILDGNTGASLQTAKTAWMEAPHWQGVRALCENSLLVKDWFELFVLQNIVLDSLINDLYYQQFDQQLADNGGQDVGMLTEFMRDWYKDSARWSDAVLKTAAKESEENKALLQQWAEQWQGRVVEALTPLAAALLDDSALANAQSALQKRLQKAGL